MGLCVWCSAFLAGLFNCIQIKYVRLLYCLDFNLDKIKENIARINPSAAVFMVSGRTGEGIEAWNDWMLEEVKEKKPKQ